MNLQMYLGCCIFSVAVTLYMVIPYLHVIIINYNIMAYIYKFIKLTKQL